MNTEQQLQNRLARWVEESLPKVMENGFESDHVDRLFPQEYSEVADTIDFSIQVFCALIDVVEAMSMPVKLSANIPLSVIVAPTIPLKVPQDIETVRNELSFEPPNLYLLTWQSPQFYDPDLVTEKFESPLPFQLSHRLSDKITVLYTEFNGEWDDDENNYVFYRHINLDYYPLGRLGS